MKIISNTLDFPLKQSNTCTTSLLLFILVSYKTTHWMGNCMESEGVVPLNNATFDPKTINHSIDIYTFPLSAPGRATLMLIKALGIKHNVITVNLVKLEHLEPNFLKMNPTHTVPVINDNGFYLYDSHVIMKYLVDRYAKDDSLYPTDPKKGALVNQRLFFEATVLFPRFTNYCQPVMHRNQEPDPEKEAQVEEALGFLDGFLKNQSWVAGDDMTIADFSIVTVITTAEAVGFDILKYPNIFEWYERCKSAMSNFGYEEVNQPGADTYGAMFKNKIQK